MRSFVLVCLVSVCDAMLASIRPIRLGKAQMLQVQQRRTSIECDKASTALDVAKGLCTCSGWDKTANEQLFSATESVPSLVFSLDAGCIEPPADFVSCRKKNPNASPNAASGCSDGFSVPAVSSCATDEASYFYPGITCVKSYRASR